MEEIDLCWRLKAEGYTNYCFPESKVYHLGGGTLSYDSSKKKPSLTLEIICSC